MHDLKLFFTLSSCCFHIFLQTFSFTFLNLKSRTNGLTWVIHQVRLSKTSNEFSLPKNNRPEFLMDQTNKWLGHLPSYWRVNSLLPCSFMAAQKLKNPFLFLAPNSTTRTSMLVLIVLWITSNVAIKVSCITTIFFSINFLTTLTRLS